MKNDEILAAIGESIDGNPALEDLRVFPRWVVAKSRRWAFAHHLPGMPGLDLPGRRGLRREGLLGQPIKRIVPRLLRSGDALGIAAGMACLNSALPVPEGAFAANAFDLFQSRSRRLRTCFIGHFPDAERWRERGYPVAIIELCPQPGDIHWERSRRALRAAEIVFITGLTLVNGTFPEVVRRTPNARHRILLGPTVPLSPLLFRYGVDLVGSTIVLDVSRALDYFRRGEGHYVFEPAGVVRRICLAPAPERAHRGRKTPPARKEVQPCG